MDSSRLDPRADLVAPVFDHRAFHSRPKSTIANHDKRVSTRSMPPASYPKRKPCYDWIFSSASNVHVAIDRSAFKTYIPFRTYVLAIADQRQVPARGIGTVEVKIKRQPGAKDSHKIILENVLHIPSWLCNIFSDVYFTPVQDFEHNWNEFGINLQQRKEGKWKAWGYTESFCGLERLVLYKDLHGRSPMLEDKDREVFSVNVAWPQHQRNKWTLIVEEESRVAEALQQKAKPETARLEQEQQLSHTDDAFNPANNEDKEAVTAEENQREKCAIPMMSSAENAPVHELGTAPTLLKQARRSLAEIDPNVKMKTSFRTNSLRVSGKSAFREALPWRKSVEQ